MTNNKAYEYCKRAINAVETPKYVKLQIKEFMAICEGRDEEAFVDANEVHRTENLLKYLNVPDGDWAKQPLYDHTSGVEWLTYTAMTCTFFKKNPKERRYDEGLIEIGRGNRKTTMIAVMFIKLCLQSPLNSIIIALAPSSRDATRVLKYMENIIQISSPAISKLFEIRCDHIEYIPKHITVRVLPGASKNIDGNHPHVWVIDELGNFASDYALTSIKRGQQPSESSLGFMISTKYPRGDNPLEQQISIAKRRLKGLLKNEATNKLFSLLYEPDSEIDLGTWETNDLILKQANPVALEYPALWKQKVKSRARAIINKNNTASTDYTEFFHKDCNINLFGATGGEYLNIDYLRECKVDSIDWGKQECVCFGTDLSETDDNTGFAVGALTRDGYFLSTSYAYIPENMIDQKVKKEHIDYRKYYAQGIVKISGKKMINYDDLVEAMVEFREKHKVKIAAVGYDNWHSEKLVSRLNDLGIKTIMIPMNDTAMVPVEQDFKEMIYSNKFKYTENPLFEINVQNAHYRTSRDSVIEKKNPNGKIDMLMATIIAYRAAKIDFINRGHSPKVVSSMTLSRCNSNRSWLQ